MHDGVEVLVEGNSPTANGNRHACRERLELPQGNFARTNGGKDELATESNCLDARSDGAHEFLNSVPLACETRRHGSDPECSSFAFPASPNLRVSDSRPYPPAYARSSFFRSSFPIFITCCITRAALAGCFALMSLLML